MIGGTRLLDSLKNALQSVYIHKEYCVNEITPRALCRECQKICPVQAIDWNEEHITINHSRCTSCGLCAAVCDHEAIGRRYGMDLFEKGAKGVQCRCMEGGVPRGREQALGQCAGGMSRIQLFMGVFKGLERLDIGTGECESCLYKGGVVLLAENIRAVNRVLEVFGRKILLKQEDFRLALVFQEQKMKDLESNSSPISRREFFLLGSKKTKEAIESGLKLTANYEQGVPKRPKLSTSGSRLKRHLQETLIIERLLGREGLRKLAQYQVVVDKGLCGAKNTCSKICPYGVFESREGQPPKTHPEYCNGCKMCEKTCSKKAITILSRLQGEGG